METNNNTPAMNKTEELKQYTEAYNKLRVQVSELEKEKDELFKKVQENQNKTLVLSSQLIKVTDIILQYTFNLGKVEEEPTEAEGPEGITPEVVG